VRGARRDSVRGGAGADEDDLRDGWGFEEFGAEGPGGVTRGFVSQARDLVGVERDGVEVAAARVGIFAVTRMGFCGEIHQPLPEGGRVAQGACDFVQRAGLRGCVSLDAQRMAWGRAARFQDYFDAIGGAEGARRVGVGIFGENFRESRGVGVKSLPPVAEGMEDDRAGAQNLLHARGIFSGNLHDHVHQLRGAEGLADQRTHAEVFGFFFGVFYGDGFGQRHSTSLGETSRPSSACGVAALSHFGVATADRRLRCSEIISGFSRGFFRQAFTNFVAEQFAVNGFAFELGARGFYHRAHLFE